LLKKKKRKTVKSYDMKTKKDILEVIYNSIDELNSQNDYEIPKKETTKLFGRDCNLDSLGLVNLISLIEDSIEEKTGEYMPIADERAFSMESSPFKTIGVLADYIQGLFNE
jgi:acyl carrier protein